MKQLVIGIKGAGEMASGIAHCLYRANLFQLFMMETAAPQAIRRLVAFSSAVLSGEINVEAVSGVRAETASDVRGAWLKKKIPIIVDPQWGMVEHLKPDVVIDAVLAKKNLGTHAKDAEMVIGLGPGFIAGEDAHVVVETNRGHHLGALIFSGAAAQNTGIPGEIGGYCLERVLRSPVDGCFVTEKKIGDTIQPGECIGTVGNQAVMAEIGGVIRGLTTTGSHVTKRFKIGDIDPRGRIEYCHTISDKARAIGGAVLTAIMMKYYRP